MNGTDRCIANCAEAGASKLCCVGTPLPRVDRFNGVTVKDQLTGLLNPDAFKLLVEHELVVARRLGRVDTLLVIDVDGLRAVNEAFGREAGDETLLAIARLLQTTARESDVIARLGGDEFAIFALDCVGDSLARRISAAAVRAGVNAAEASDRELNVRIHIAISETQPGEEFDELIARAGPTAFSAIRGANRPDGSAR